MIGCANTGCGEEIALGLPHLEHRASHLLRCLIRRVPGTRPNLPFRTAGDVGRPAQPRAAAVLCWMALCALRAEPIRASSLFACEETLE
jgi:hypothetical protein